MRKMLTRRPSRDEHEIDFTQREELFQANRVLSSWKLFSVVFAMVAIVCFLVLNWAIHFVTHIRMSGLSLYSTQSSIAYAFLPVKRFALLYLAAAGFALYYYGRKLYSFRTSHKDLNVGQKGTAKWTERKQIPEQYKEIAALAEPFPGIGGLPVACDRSSSDTSKWKYYIDDSPVNTLILGMTRSGKGEIFIFPMIDNLSRAYEQSSIIVTDPKLELYAGSVKTLMERGYDVHILNLVDPAYSMGYNPITRIVDYWKSGDTDTAKELASTFAYSVFAAEGGADGESKYFIDTSSAILAGLILAMIEDCLTADEELEKRRAAVRAQWEEQPEEYWPPDVPRAHEVSHESEEKINMYSIAQTFLALATTATPDGRTELDAYFAKRPEDNTAKLLFLSGSIAGERQRANVYSNMIAGIKTFMMSENVARLTMKSTADFTEIGFGTKPTAIFIGMPDYDKSKYFIASCFISQIYITLAEMATHAPGGKCARQVDFLIDEFGNLPPIKDIDSYVTVGLGRKIRFTLVIQANSQLSKHYGELASTISGNCGNKVFLLSADNETADEYSDSLGERTMTVLNRTGRKLSDRKEFTEMFDAQKLLTPQELSVLTEGEVIIVRKMKRRDLKGKPIRPYPIKNLGAYKMPYRYEFLAEYFNPAQLPYDSPKVREIHQKTRAFQLAQYAAGRIKESEIIDENPKVLDIPVETTEDIDYKARLWSAKEYLARREFGRNVPLKVFGEGVLCNILMDKFKWDREEYSDLVEHFLKGDEETGYLIADIENCANHLAKSDDKESSVSGYLTLDLIEKYYASEVSGTGKGELIALSDIFPIEDERDYSTIHPTARYGDIERPLDMHRMTDYYDEEEDEMIHQIYSAAADSCMGILGTEDSPYIGKPRERRLTLDA